MRVLRAYAYMYVFAFFFIYVASGDSIFNNPQRSCCEGKESIGQLSRTSTHEDWKILGESRGIHAPLIAELTNRKNFFVAIRLFVHLSLPPYKKNDLCFE